MPNNNNDITDIDIESKLLESYQHIKAHDDFLETLKRMREDKEVCNRIDDLYRDFVFDKKIKYFCNTYYAIISTISRIPRYIYSIFKYPRSRDDRNSLIVQSNFEA